MEVFKEVYKDMDGVDIVDYYKNRETIEQVVRDLEDKWYQESLEAAYRKRCYKEDFSLIVEHLGDIS